MAWETQGWVWSLDLASNEKLVALAIGNYGDKDGNKLFPGMENICAYTNLSVSTVRRCINSLLKDGVLVLVKESDGRGHATEYRMPVNMQTVADFHKRNQTEKGVSLIPFVERVANGTGKGISVTGKGCQADTPNLNLNLKEQTLNISADFEEFWRVYPYRVSGEVKSKNGKQKAAAKYAIARRKHSHVFLVEALHKFRASCNPKYVPDAARWLGDSMFNNEVLAAPAAKSDSGMKWL
jgi:hypothetical protein